MTIPTLYLWPLGCLTILGISNVSFGLPQAAREVLNSNGFPDPSIRQGLYRRVYSPLAGSRPGRRSSDEM